MKQKLLFISAILVSVAINALSQTGLIWSDEFDSAEVYQDNWIVIDEADGTDSWYRPANVEISDGTLKLHSKEEIYNNKHWTGARLDATIHPQYKYLEARVRIAEPDAHVWATWWTIGWVNDASKWPPEFDIFELQGGAGKSPGQWYHYKTSSGQNTYVGKDTGLDESEWHTYGVYWNSSGPVLFYVDSVLSYIADLGSGAPPAMAAKLKLTSSPNSRDRYTGCLLAAMEIDYVRVYDTPPYTEPTDLVVIFTKPGNGDTLSGAIAINAIAYNPLLGTSDGDGITNVVFELINNSTVVYSKQENIAPYDWNINTVQFENGTYIIKANANSVSVDGVITKTDSVEVTIINAEPSIYSTAIDGSKDALLFPNPVKDILTLDLKIENWNLIQIYNTSGEIVYTKNLEHYGTYSLDINHLPNGVYILRLKGSINSYYRFLKYE